MQVRSFFRRKLIVHDENDRFVELSGWRWTVVKDDAGSIAQQFEGSAEVITTDHAELATVLGEEVLAASEAAAAARAAELQATQQLEAAQARIAELQSRNAALETEVASLKAPSAGAAPA